MSLVAYDDSDDETSDEGENTQVRSKTPEKKEAGILEKETVVVKNSDSEEEVEEFSILDTDKTDDGNEVTDSSPKNSSLFPSLPAPQSKVPTLDVDWIDNRSRLKSQEPVKILIPSLSKFEEEEPEEPVRKKIKPSAKGSGLFALLPKPKSEAASLKLVPQSIKNKEPTAVKQPVKPINSAPNVPKPEKKIVLMYDSDEDDVDEGHPTDFFSLTSKPVEATPNIPTVDVSHEPDVSPINDSSNYSQSNHNYQPATYSDSARSTNDYLQLPSNKGESTPSEDYIPFNSSSLDLDENALRQLCGRKDRNLASTQVLDVQGDNLVMNSREWLLQSISEEKKQKSHKRNNKDGPSSTERRKHQITYLAFQAKENELELKNTWANNRQTKKQTQAKYGF